MNRFKAMIVLLAGVFCFQFANAQLQTVVLGNEDPCPTAFELVWNVNGNIFCTVHTVPPGNGNFQVSAPGPIVQASVARGGGSPVVTFAITTGTNQLISSQCCTSYAACDNIVETSWNGSSNSVLGIGAH